ncbi:hypothetical protein DPMN_038282 [Dreissena polymorpha]|uniref:Uncharacterized protein n=1 Tax=Dreissena polymorpha TaxID=45954 RepID=A0A9D4RQ22_DREPO|nr:hypothetical protein DPMN_038282 [Dreissena polymorpha]
MVGHPVMSIVMNFRIRSGLLIDEVATDDVEEDENSEFQPSTHRVIPVTRPSAHLVTSRLAPMAFEAKDLERNLSKNELWDL